MGEEGRAEGQNRGAVWIVVDHDFRVLLQKRFLLSLWGFIPWVGKYIRFFPGPWTANPFLVDPFLLRKEPGT